MQKKLMKMGQTVTVEERKCKAVQDRKKLKKERTPKTQNDNASNEGKNFKILTRNNALKQKNLETKCCLIMQA